MLSLELPLPLDLVVKLGGSLLANGSVSPLLDTLGELARSHRVAVVPGGGPFADSVRQACALNEPGASASHWMAILAMDQHAHLLAGLFPAARLTSQPDEIDAAAAEGRLAVVAPFRWLRAADPLPHGWQVTSDSIAAWIAGRLTARSLVLLKSLEGASDPAGELLAEIDAESAAAAGIVDEHFERALPPGLDCWLLSGRHPERLAELLRDGRTRGTRVRKRSTGRSDPMDRP